ncbi:sensor histidine kinase [Paraclostridium bifermentans]|uniref:sensor histidine kinase n=1 Tax=Paraclostridium bifermentans TaxID=1490 RepID=UPI002FCCEC8F
MINKKYYDEIESVLSNLDRKYLLPEVLKKPSFIEGRMVNDVLKEVSRDMHENVKKYKDIQNEYKEYIEMWVHEIKTPIASTKLIVENNKNEITKKIDIQLCKIENFIDQVLYYSRSEEVCKDYFIKEIQLGSEINKVLQRNYRDFISKKIKLNIGDINKTIYSDSKWVGFILNQILSNSIKYCKPVEGVISIYCEEKPSSLILIIEDNGVGICEKDINRVFEKGFTGENGRKFGKSTGIGLYLCKKLCNRLGLNLTIESTENIGTKIKFIFPKYNIYEKS